MFFEGPLEGDPQKTDFQKFMFRSQYEIDQEV